MTDAEAARKDAEAEASTAAVIGLVCLAWRPLS